MIIRSESDMIAFGEKIAEGFIPPATIELVGDVGAGKTTLVKGIAKGLGIIEGITSPSFTIAKTYQSKNQATILKHYDFYRLADPGIMQEELDESINDPNTTTIIEWASTVQDILPTHRTIISINYNDDGTRTVEVKK
jgi:tRNA threonylcarbamoyladenosine biosynthesis protein TsaE